MDSNISIVNRMLSFTANVVISIIYLIATVIHWKTEPTRPLHYVELGIYSYTYMLQQTDTVQVFTSAEIFTGSSPKIITMCV